MSFAFGLWVGTLAAAVAAVPAALRVAEPGPAWLALSGAAALAVGPAMAGVVRARPLADGVWAVLVGLGLASLPLALFAYRLQIGTHHRPLGAVTFTIGAAVVVLLAIALAARLLAWTHTANSATERSIWLRRLLAAAALAGPLILALLVVTTAAGRRGVFDVTLCLGLSAAALLRAWPAALVRIGSKAAIPLWLAVVGAGAAVAFGGAGAEAKVASPALFAPLGWALR